MTGPIISLVSVDKAFAGHPVLTDASLEIRAGEIVAILGASGSGKSVTLKTINGLIVPDAGEIHVLGHAIHELEEKELNPLRRRVSYLFQGGALFDSMTVFDNVAFPIREHMRFGKEDLSIKVQALLEMVQLQNLEHLHPSELSGGMRKRVAVARALALEPEIILYDEPTTGLDPVTGEAIANLILDLNRRLGMTSVVVTHDIPLVMRVAERILFLEEGRFCYSGTIENARSEGPETVKKFFEAGVSHA
ncbi:MAG: ATP-binding cassette domain-containing protein [Thermoanaerobaculales bacterium]|nr:ATP-binding cassette domain-containing protein [Thermoanaerobaculales bacterium]